MQLPSGSWEVDFAIVGDGVIGRALACELARRGSHVAVVTRESPGQASWASAGILSPGASVSAVDPWDKLLARGREMYADWTGNLTDQTGIDCGLVRCGGVYLARSVAEAVALEGLAQEWRDRQIGFQRLGGAELAERVSALAHLGREVRLALYSDDEWQVRPPRLLDALRRACVLSGVTEISSPAPLEWDIDVPNHDIRTLTVAGRQIAARAFCVAAGAWSARVLSDLGVHISMLPVRGQIVLFKLDRPPCRPIINEQGRYLVPRDDGHVLIGSTIEEAGFDASTTDDAVAALVSFGRSLVPEIDGLDPVATWAGLRPATYDGRPYMGRVGGWQNLFVSTGHFRNGIQVAPAAAEALADLMMGRASTIDLAPFSTARG